MLEWRVIIIIMFPTITYLEMVIRRVDLSVMYHWYVFPQIHLPLVFIPDFVTH